MVMVGVVHTPHGGSVVVDKGRSLKGARFSLLLPLTSSQLERKAPVPLPPVKPPSLQDEHAT